ncbi:MAG: TrpB-like pyridoxal-phosphate dependent enzyme [Chloroflexi bacterium GWB2_49_20]|nr:MAG: TrpB-like pyridoxal-phosphate dependent enzyme [Chloroflexi bacterium GWB2_49_20]OGN79864.1 MAG: TrpB-like pyridoxal-phosphate dependent enzyme [Chloroflexi bacterium GWC2_49_37]OGN85601.1 MAG: TrpB-like pyridoxal-phosphate dependent enzyme [Chloroflexi bacterium GWD2_49_16]HBG74479.1 TrpB-like pyridoxal phosphate-dependent enzyme [Anaerolineae bacterium]HCC79648.1 TrpB-like pyridoxal phosphate-dependent enzyme [Anaerolineae bacterium]
MSEQTGFTLNETDLPKQWYNVLADSPVPPQPVLHPGTKEPVTPEFLSVLFPMELILQEISTDRFIDIPQEVSDIYKLYRPTPLIRARRLEKVLGTPAHIYYKNESVSPVGSHKPNTAIPQAFYNKAAGTKAITTETGAGQWGTALAMACNFFEMDLEVYMVKISYQQKPYRRIFMETYGAQVFASPTDRTDFGRSLLAKDPENGGSLGIAISEAVEVAAKSGGTKKYSLGSVLNHVLMHQTVIGEEALKQMDLAGEYPDVVIGCVGGGSNFAGIAYPFLRQNLKDGQRTRLLAVEPTATPSLTKGVYAFDYGDTAMMAPIVKMHTLGHTFMPAGIHAGGLRYHGMAPSLSALYDAGYIEAVAIPQVGTFEAAVMFTKAEGILPAPESAHAIRVAIDEALDAKVKGEKRVILFNLSGHGHFDMMSYQQYLSGMLVDYAYPSAAVAEAIQTLPQVEMAGLV